MATTKITDLTAYTDPVNTDVLPIVDVTSDVTKKVSIANVMKNASLGSNTAPGIAFDGDPNTGIYSPGADQVAVTTGGTQRLLIDSSGAVTIAGDLTVNGTTTNINTTNLVVEDKNIVLGDVTSPTDVTADGGGITLKGTTDKTLNWVDATDAWTSSEHVNIASGKEYRIAGTKVLDATSLGSAVLITSANITDGTIVNADINASAAIAGTKVSPDFGSQNITTTGTSTAASFIPSSSTAPTNGLYLPAANSVALATGGSQRLVINSSGQVGIGASPTDALFVQGSAVNFNVQSLSSSASTSFKWGNDLNTKSTELWLNGSTVSTFGGASAFNIYQSAAAPILVHTNGTERLRITSAGLVGIGTSSPNNKFTLQDGTVLVRSEVTTGASNSNHIGFSATSTGGIAATISSYRENANEASALTFNTWNGSAFGERARIDSSGRLGIGTTSPNVDLEVTTSGGGTIRAARSSAVSNYIQIDADGTNGTLRTSGASTNLLFNTNGSERARIDTSGRLLLGTSSNTRNSTIVAQGHSGSSTGPAHFRLNRGDDAPTAGSPDLGYVFFGTSDLGSDGGAWILGQRDGGTWSSTSKPGRLVFSTTLDGASSPTERTRISNQGILYNVSTANGFIVSSTVAAGTGNELIEAKYSATAGTAGSGTTSFRVYTNGNVQNTNNSYGQISDIKLKENIVDANSQWSDLKAVRVRNFNFKEGQTHKQIGVIAQELEEVSPGLVYETPDRDEDGNETGEVTKGVNYSVLYMKAVKALQEAMERIETLEAKVAALEAS